MLYGVTCKLYFLLPNKPTNSKSLPTAASMTANQSQVFSQALDYYLGDGAKWIPKIHDAAIANTKEGDELLLR